jgi:hypothetical protein
MITPKSSGSAKDHFLNSCAGISLSAFLNITITGFLSFKFASNRLISLFNEYAESIEIKAKFSSDDRYIVGPVHAICAVLGSLTALPQFAKTNSSVDNAAIVYSAITMVDAWIDSGKKSAGYKFEYIRLVQDLLEFGPAASYTTEGVSLLPEHIVLLRLAHDRLRGSPGWDLLLRDFDFLVRAGELEFTATTPSACLRATSLVGAYSAGVIFDVIFIDTAETNRKTKWAIMQLGAIMNIIDDIFDHADDIRSGRRTFVTQSLTVETGQDYGYTNGLALWKNIKNAKVGQIQMMQNTIAIWWLRNRFKSKDLTLREVQSVFNRNF